MSRRILRRASGAACLLAFLLISGAAAADTLRVVATTPALASLARAVGGDAVDVTAFAKGPQDPHFVEPRPSFVRALHRADALVLVGLDLEVGWLPALQRSARNGDVMPGGRGYLDASSVIEPLEVPTTRVDRSMGDVHALGNPHYLTDPLNGLRVAGFLRDRFSRLRPGSADAFTAGHDAFARRLLSALLGESLASGADPDTLLERAAAGGLADDPALAGWLGTASRAGDPKAVQDHRLWPYFARRFGVELVETLEPQPGIAPTTSHLREVVERIDAVGVRLVLASPYFDPRHARFVAEKTGARVVPMAHQPGSRPDTDDYLAMIAYNVERVFEASSGGP